MIERFFAETLLKKEGVYTEEQADCLEKLMRECKTGHLCASRDRLGEAIDTLPSSLVCDMTEQAVLNPGAPIVKHENRYYLQKNWVYETYILEQVQRLRRQAAPSYFDKALFEAGVLELSVSGRLTLKQAEAARSVLDRSLTLICGGPGTGKTYTAGHLARLLFSSLKPEEKKRFRLCLAAPTGKAAFHLRASLEWEDSALHIEASTLHRLLKLQPGKPRLFSGRFLDADLVIVDEASMIDAPLLAHLLEAIGEETLLVLIGDPHQLPPVEAASLFAEMGSAFGVALDQCLRTEEKHLQQLAQAVKEGNAEWFGRLLDLKHPSAVRLEWPLDSFFVRKLYQRIEPVISATKPSPADCLRRYNQFRVLGAIRQGPFGTDYLNEQILHQLQCTGLWWAAPILATVNDPYDQLYNGMGGLLIGRSQQDAAAYFPDPSSDQLRFFPSPPPYELAFCLSVHKSQGSEFSSVLALFPEGSEPFGRESLYTAITRAKKEISILGSSDVLEKMIAATSLKQSDFTARFLSASKSELPNT